MIVMTTYLKDGATYDVCKHCNKEWIQDFWIIMTKINDVSARHVTKYNNKLMMKNFFVNSADSYPEDSLAAGPSNTNL